MGPVPTDNELLARLEEAGRLANATLRTRSTRTVKACLCARIAQQLLLPRASTYLTRTLSLTAGTACRCDTKSLFELFPRQRREPPVSLGESRGLNKERP